MPASRGATRRSWPLWPTASSSAREQGWVAGLGIDYGLTPHISIGVEYDYVHFNIGTRDQVPTAVGPAGSQANGGIDTSPARTSRSSLL